jgi:hypothetical protein
MKVVVRYMSVHPAFRLEDRTMSRYVVATKRESRRDGITAKERLLEFPDVEIKGGGNSDRLVIESSPQTIDKILRRFGEKLIIEPEIFHYIK